MHAFYHPITLWVIRCCLHMPCLFKNTWKSLLTNWSLLLEITTVGNPFLKKMFFNCEIINAMVAFLIGIASGHLITISTYVNKYSKLPFDLGNGPTRSIHTLFYGIESISGSCIGLCLGFILVCYWQVSHDLQC